MDPIAHAIASETISSCQHHLPLHLFAGAKERAREITAQLSFSQRCTLDLCTARLGRGCAAPHEHKLTSIVTHIDDMHNTNHSSIATDLRHDTERTGPTVLRLLENQETGLCRTTSLE